MKLVLFDRMKARTALGLAVALVAAAGAAGGSALSDSAAGRRPLGNIVCTQEIKATVSGGVIRYCGPATAHLSVFAHLTYRHGSCTWFTRNGFDRLTVSVGARTTNLATNGRRAYFSLQTFGPPPHPTSGDVIAYSKGKRWTGVGLSFRLSASGGTFVARGTNGIRGKARGSFRC